MINLAQMLRDKEVVVKDDFPLGTSPETGRVVKIEVPLGIKDFWRIFS